jgi:outer membrane receptor protein involved in Fe transport
LDADYDQPLTDNLRGFVGTSLNYVDTTLYQFVVPQPLAPRGKARTVIDGRIGVGSIDKGWQVALIGTNLGNKRAVEFASTISAGGGAYYGTRNRPRTVAIQFTLNR